MIDVSLPLCIVAAIEATGKMAIDPLNKITEISGKLNIWLHVDGALQILIAQFTL